MTRAAPSGPPFPVPPGVPQDPLAEWPRPKGDPTAVQSSRQAFEPMDHKLQTVSHSLKQSTGQVVSGEWLGQASAHCEGAVDGFAAAYTRSGDDAHTGAAAMGACANRWTAALDQYDHARALANEALREEARHRENIEAKAQQLDGAQADQAAAMRAQAQQWTCEPERSKAVRMAREAIANFEGATRKAVEELHSTTQSMGNFTQAFGYQGSPMLKLLPSIAGMSPEQLKALQAAQRAAGIMGDGEYTKAELARLERLLDANAGNPAFGPALIRVLGPMGLTVAVAGLPKGTQALQRQLRTLVTEAQDQLGPAEYRRALKAYWTGIAYKNAGIDPTQWNPAAGAAANREIIAKVYRYYGDLYLEHPYMRWAGLANMVGPAFAAGMFDLHKFHRIADVLSRLPDGALPPGVAGSLDELAQLTESELRFYEKKFLEMEKQIFDDMAPMHEAYLHGGMEAIREMHEAGIIDTDTLEAWQDIDRGRDTGNQDLIAQGNKYLAHREQFDIIADEYDEMRNHYPSGEAFTYGLTLIGEPSIPGAKGYADVFPITVTTETPGPEQLTYPDDLGPIPLPGEGVTVDNPVQGTVITETPFPDGNISKRQDRWALIEEDSLPAYRHLITEEPQRAREVIAMPVEQRIDNYRIDERIDDILRQLSDWDSRFRQ